MKKLFLVLFASMLCATLTGCLDSNENDKKDKDGDESLIVGTWNFFKEWENDYGYEYYEDGEYGLLFKANGTGYTIEDGEIDWPFEWAINGSKLYIEYADDDEIETATITTLNKSELTLSYYNGEYIEYYERIR